MRVMFVIVAGLKSIYVASDGNVIRVMIFICVIFATCPTNTILVIYFKE